MSYEFGGSLSETDMRFTRWMDGLVLCFLVVLRSDRTLLWFE